ncbi:MAG: DNA polymerase II [Spirochaetaceae bacterium]|nr:DNA polymerase II [Spirochaetaceae bacterium]MDT8296786.1 DNA polymerase II [Spirochaetaceae bacterium]
MPYHESDIFFLTSESSDRSGGCELRYWGIGPNGPILVRVPEHRPLFFISRDSVLPGEIRCERRPLELRGFDEKGVDGLYFSSLASYRDARFRLADSGVRTWESDVRPEDRFLMERFIRGSARIAGEVRQEGVLTTYPHPKLSPSEWCPSLRTLSLDIETGRDGRLYGIAIDANGPGPGVRRVCVLDERASPVGPSERLTPVPGTPEGPPPDILRRPDQAGLLRFLIVSVAEIDPDVIIGWHVIGFDLSFLDKKSVELGLPLRIGRGRMPLRLTERPGSLPIADLEGRLIIDGPPALRGAFHKFSDWRLDTVAHELLGRGKDIETHGREKVDEIERRFRDDKIALAAYNLDDTVLVTEIFRRTGVLEQMVTRSLITGLPPDQVHRSVASFDRFFLPRLHRKGYVAPNQADIVSSGQAPGALVFTSGAGLFEDVAVLDFKSLYPTLIRTFHIDPYSFIRSGSHPLETPVDISFSRSEHILPAYLGELMDRREKAKSEGDVPLAQAIKILMNSMYGVMGSPGCRFYRAELPTAITGIGRWVLETTSSQLKEWGYEVLYGDTDSVFVKLKTEERTDPDAAGRRLAVRVDTHFRDLIRGRYGVPSRLEMEYEKRYVRLFLPSMRSGTEAAVKRYAGLLPGGDLEIKGMEFVRSDSTMLAREFQHELFRRYFAGEDLSVWIRDVVTRLKEGEFDDKLVYRRRLSRSAKDYKSPPPHVRAVKLLDPDGKKDLRDVEYLITPEGPIPMELNPQDIDYNHYVEKQLKSLADDVLIHQGTSFDAVIAGKQLDLFS